MREKTYIKDLPPETGIRCKEKWQYRLLVVELFRKSYKAGNGEPFIALELWDLYGKDNTVIYPHTGAYNTHLKSVSTTNEVTVYDIADFTDEDLNNWKRFYDKAVRVRGHRIPMVVVHIDPNFNATTQDLWGNRYNKKLSELKLIRL